MAILQRLISSHCWWGGGEMGRLGRDDGTLAPIQRWGQRHAEMVVLLSQVIAALLGQLRSRIVRSRRQRPHLIL